MRSHPRGAKAYHPPTGIENPPDTYCILHPPDWWSCALFAPPFSI